MAFFAVVLAGFAIAAAVWEQLLSAHPGANELDYPNFEGRGLAMVAIYASAGATFIAVVHDLSRHIGAIELAAGVQPWWAGDPQYSRPLRAARKRAHELAAARGTVALAVVTFLQRPWAAALLALVDVPGLLLFVPLLVLNTLQPEDGAAEPVALGIR